MKNVICTVRRVFGVGFVSVLVLAAGPGLAAPAVKVNGVVETKTPLADSLAAPGIPATEGGAVPAGELEARSTVYLPPLSHEVRADLISQPPLRVRGPLQIGIARTFTPIEINSSTAPADKWLISTQGWHTYSVQLTSSEALGLRLHLESLKLPGAAQISIYDPANPGAAHAPITAKSLGGQTQLWTPTVFADTVVVECEVPSGTNVKDVSFSISELSHLYRLPGQNGIERGEAESCEKDVTCYPAYAQSASGVALMDYVEGGNTYNCSGCLIASTIANSATNYFLTANHCIANQALASTIELYWFYQTATCNGPRPSLSSVPSTGGGAILLATAVANDFTFLQLNEAPPPGAYALPWSTNAPETNETLVIVHHPAGDYTRISFGNYYGSDADFWAVQWFNGVTEDGSSGSPLLNSQQQVIGQLNGGFDGPGSSCTDPSAPDQFGRFDLTYPAIQRWIDPTAPVGQVNTNDVSTNDISTNVVTENIEPLKGTYNGLFFDSGAGVSQDSAGYFTLSVSASGKFSGHLQIGSASHSFSGKFDDTGSGQATIKRAKQSPLTVQLQLDTDDTNAISGIVSDGTFNSQLSGDREVYNSRLNEAPEAGQYTMLIAGDESGTNGLPDGNGYATVTVNTAGKISVNGWLADGTHFTQSTFVSENGQWPFYVSLYGGRGSLFSWISFPNLDNSGFTGTLNWFKPALISSRYYPEGFDFATTISGSPYTRPDPAASQPILQFSDADLSLTNDDGSISLSEPILLNPNDRITDLSSDRINLSFNGGNGTFTGRVQNPGTTHWIDFSGVVLQNQNAAVGYFLYNGQSGVVSISGQ